MTLETVSANKMFGGWNKQFTHESNVLACQMRFAIYLPPQASTDNRVPVVYWLSGLTCTDENFMHKAGAQRAAAALGVAIVAPDTSPRGAEVPDDPNGDYDFGLGAGFYVNATQSPWSANYKMYDYVVDELPQLVEANFPVSSQRAISGHSMGGHGALVVALRNVQRYVSVSAFAPICNPMDCGWGRKAFSNYLGANEQDWAQYDASVLLAAHRKAISVDQAGDLPPILIDQGREDDFLTNQLKPHTLEHDATEHSEALQIRMHEGYDHSYFFIASFIEEHLTFHAQQFADQPPQKNG